MDSLLLKPLEAGNELRVSRSKVYELISSGAIPAIKVGGNVRVPRAALKDWVDKQVALLETA